MKIHILVSLIDNLTPLISQYSKADAQMFLELCTYIEKKDTRKGLLCCTYICKNRFHFYFITTKGLNLKLILNNKVQSPLCF